MAFQNHSLKGYNQYSSWQLKDILTEVSSLSQNLSDALSLTSGPLIVADYGCSEGYNSMILFQNVLKNFRDNSNRPVQIYHNDLPDNDWVLFNEMMNTSESSYLKYPNSSYSTIGRSFYNQIFPSESVHVGFSGFAFHYLSKKILKNPGENNLGTEELVKQSQIDLNTLLKYRINELVIGGTLTIIAISPETDDAIKSITVQPFIDLVQNGVIPYKEVETMAPSIHPITLNEWNQALSNFNNEIEIIRLESFRSLCPYYSRYLEDKDFEKFKEDLSGAFITIASVQINSFASLTYEEKQNVIKLYRQGMKDAIKPEMTEYYWGYSTLVIRKIKNIL